jgi:hypothetical protein
MPVKKMRALEVMKATGWRWAAWWLKVQFNVIDFLKATTDPGQSVKCFVRALKAFESSPDPTRKAAAASSIASDACIQSWRRIPLNVNSMHEGLRTSRSLARLIRLIGTFRGDDCDLKPPRVFDSLTEP